MLMFNLMYVYMFDSSLFSFLFLKLFFNSQMWAGKQTKLNCHSGYIRDFEDTD